MSEASKRSELPVIWKRTPAERARYLEGRVDELLHCEGAVPRAMFPLMFSLSIALADFAELLEDVDE